MNEEELARAIALPSKLGAHLGQALLNEPYVIYPWLEYAEQRIVTALMDDTAENIIIINLPPQVGKSTYCGLFLPFWITGMFPDWPLIFITYAAQFAEQRGKEVRAMQERWGRQLFGTSIDPDFQSAGEWRLSGHRGGMLSVGIGGGITGKPARVIIIDDLIKNSIEATSETTKKSHISEWDNTITTRFQPGTTVIVVATRWAEDDLSGHIIEQSKRPDYAGPKVEVIEFPAFALPPDDMDFEDDEQRAAWRDILGRKEGEVLDCRFSRIPGRSPDAFFAMKKATMDAFSFSCLYQQRPTAREGGMFPPENWQFYDPNNLPPVDREVRVWDIAATEGGGDWTTGTKMALCGEDFYVVDVERHQMNAANVQGLIERTAAKDGFGVKIMLEEERGGSGPSVTAAYKRFLRGHVVEPAKAETSKESRAIPYSAEQNKRRVFLPHPGSVHWDVKGFIEEHRRMMGDGRRPKHDDRIDTAAYAMLELLSYGAVEVWTPLQQMERDLYGGVDEPEMDPLVREPAQ